MAKPRHIGTYMTKQSGAIVSVWDRLLDPQDGTRYTVLDLVSRDAPGAEMRETWGDAGLSDETLRHEALCWVVDRDGHAHRVRFPAHYVICCVERGLWCHVAAADEGGTTAMTRLYSAIADFDSDGEVDSAAICAAEWAAYKQALDKVIDLDPVLLSEDVNDPVTMLDEAAVALFNAGWFAGIRAAAAHAAGLGFAVPEDVCNRCHGHGRLWDGSCIRKLGATEIVCPDCGGFGTVGIAGDG